MLYLQVNPQPLLDLLSDAHDALSHGRVPQPHPYLVALVADGHHRAVHQLAVVVEGLACVGREKGFSL